MRDSKGRFCKATKFKVWDRVTHTKNNPHEVGVIQSMNVDGRSCKVWWPEWHGGCMGMAELFTDLRHAPAPSTKFSVGDVVTIDRQVGRWRVNKCEQSRYYCFGVDGPGRSIWAKPEQMSKVECVEQVPTKPASSPQIIPGSVVRLRSGGPEMTVNVTNACGLEGIASASYFHNGKVFDALVHIASLEFVR